MINLLDTTNLEHFYEPVFTEYAIQQQIEEVQKGIAYLLVIWVNADEKTFQKIDNLLIDLSDHNSYLKKELETFYVPQR